MGEQLNWISESGGIGLEISPESFAVRALFGTIVAVVLAYLVAKRGWVKSAPARRLMITAPLITAITSATAVIITNAQFFPTIIVASNEGQTLEVFNTAFTVRRIDVIVVAYLVVVAYRLLRRSAVHWAAIRYVRSASENSDKRIQTIVTGLAAELGIRIPTVLRLDNCPGGAFTTGMFKTVLVFDNELPDRLDDEELEGLIAHELGHVVRRDVLTNSLAGIVGDFLFFLPPVAAALRWLRHEQERSADDVASRVTGRPAALASSIMKVWEGRRGTVHPVDVACSAMVPTASVSTSRMSSAARLVAERVIRLIDDSTVSDHRARVELFTAVSAVLLVTGATIVLPASYGSEVMLAQWRLQSSATAESPAMATFRHTAPFTTVTIGNATNRVDRSSTCEMCIAVETQAQWRAQTPAALPLDPGSGRRIWESPDGNQRANSARVVWGVDSAEARMGVFVVND